MWWLKKLFGGSKHQPPVERTSLTIEAGDIVAYGGTDYQVARKLTYTQGPYTWYDYQLLDGEDELWLGAEDDDGLVVTIYSKISINLPHPPPQRVNHNGKSFLLDEHGESVVVEDTGTETRNLRVSYWDYEDEDENEFLCIEDWSGDIETSWGFEIKAYELEIYPRSLAATVGAAGLETSCYHVHVPSFGEWAFVIAADHPVNLKEITIPFETRFLTPEVLQAASLFPPDIAAHRPEATLNTLSHPTLMDLYHRAWQRW